jgi:hypothetical protein
MRRLVKALRGALAVCCVLLFFLSAALWIRSLSYWDVLAVRVGRVHVSLNTWPDVVNVGVTRRVEADGATGDFEWRFIPAEIDTERIGRNWKNFNWSAAAGNEWDPVRKRRYRIVGHYLTLPFWLVMSVSGVPLLPRGVRWLRDRRRRLRVRRGVCAACGYDLRASPDRCPECGRESGVGA